MGIYAFKLPDIGEGVVEGEVVEWMVAVGDTVTEDQPILSVMTDKATVEIPSPVNGVVVKRVGDVGDVVDESRPTPLLLRRFLPPRALIVVIVFLRNVIHERILPFPFLL